MSLVAVARIHAKGQGTLVIDHEHWFHRPAIKDGSPKQLLDC